MSRLGGYGPSCRAVVVSIVETVHELSICSSIADIVTRHAAGRTVQVINVRAGQLRQIVPDTLVYCWGLVSARICSLPRTTRFPGQLWWF